MLVELVIVGVVLYVLLMLHKQDLAKGGEGIAVIGPILEDVEKEVKQFQTRMKKRGKRNGGNGSRHSSSISEDGEMPRSTPSNSGEKFETVHPPAKRRSNRTKHHHRHRSKLEHGVVVAQKKTSEE